MNKFKAKNKLFTRWQHSMSKSTLYATVEVKNTIKSTSYQMRDTIFCQFRWYCKGWGGKSYNKKLKIFTKKGNEIEMWMNAEYWLLKSRKAICYLLFPLHIKKVFLSVPTWILYHFIMMRNEKCIELFFYGRKLRNLWLIPRELISHKIYRKKWEMVGIEEKKRGLEISQARTFLKESSLWAFSKTHNLIAKKFIFMNF